MKMELYVLERGKEIILKRLLLKWELVIKCFFGFLKWYLVVEEIIS